MRRNLNVNCVVDELEMLELLKRPINKQIKFKNEAAVFERTREILKESREKRIAVTSDVVTRIFSCLFIANEICHEYFTHQTIADLGGISATTITRISNKIGRGLDIRHMW